MFSKTSGRFLIFSKIFFCGLCFPLWILHPKYSISSWQTHAFFLEMITPNFLRVNKTPFTLSRCWNSILSENTKISSIYTCQYFLCGSKIFSMCLWKILGACFKHIGITFHWNNPYGQVKVVSFSVWSSILIWRNPNLQLNTENSLASLILAIKTSILGKGYASSIVFSFKAL